MRGNEYDRCSWKKSELIYIVLVGLVLEGILVFLFYNSFAVFIGALIPFQIIFIWYCGRARVKERRHRLEVGFRELLTSISSSLSAGYSVAVF